MPSPLRLTPSAHAAPSPRFISYRTLVARYSGANQVLSEDSFPICCFARCAAARPSRGTKGDGGRRGNCSGNSSGRSSPGSRRGRRISRCRARQRDRTGWRGACLGFHGKKSRLAAQDGCGEPPSHSKLLHQTTCLALLFTNPQYFPTFDNERARLEDMYVRGRGSTSLVAMAML
jgi:hypothetical protein